MHATQCSIRNTRILGTFQEGNILQQPSADHNLSSRGRNSSKALLRGRRRRKVPSPSRPLWILTGCSVLICLTIIAPRNGFGTIAGAHSKVEEEKEEESMFFIPETTIPKLIIMMDKASSFSDIDKLRRKNAINTIQIYQDAWGEKQMGGFSNRSNGGISTMPAGLWYLNNADCENLIKRVENRLVKYFLNETEGMYKADICRVAALYEKGGYYFDTDMEVIQPLNLAPHITFSTVRAMYNEHEFFQSFLAVAPKHPIMKLNMELLLKHYQIIDENSTMLFKGLLGPESLYQSYIEFNKTEDFQNWPIDLDLKEVLGPAVYPRLRQRGKSYNCNIVVHNATQKVPYFYSRIIGAGKNCPE